ncbi:glycosyltransferase [Catellatospora sp. NPDC049609]|uniref:glycosyltransferase n=1 Tax=Catellatospora sp. NPDC049609 TaxID=3155505 RepID=UPI00341584CF
MIVAAHNEATVIGKCLDSLLEGTEPDELDIIVVANGCSDATAAVARTRRGVRVIELTEAGKALALNAGDAAATTFPRVYLDADVVLTKGALSELADALDELAPQGVHAVMPRRSLVTTGRTLPVRAYYAINSRLPIFEDALFGRGVITLSRAGRARFDRFPNQVADDLFLDSLFDSAEKRQIATATSFVQTPVRARDLIRTLARVRAGNVRLRATHTGIRETKRSSWLRDVVLPRPTLLPAAVCYVAITVIAALRARRQREGSWGRDNSTR